MASLPSKRSLVYIKDHNSKIGAVCLQQIFNIANKAIVADGYFSIGLSGGSIPNILLAGLESTSIPTDFSKWRIVFVDERCVPLDNADSSYKAFIPLFTKLNIPSESMLLIDSFDDVDQASANYNQKFAAMVPGGSVHIALLGMGPDGHTASLFPGALHNVEGGSLYMPVRNSPKPPPNRITMTLDTLNKAKQVIFIITGEAKAELLFKFLHNVKTNTLVNSADQDSFSCLYTEDEGTPASKLRLHAASDTDSHITLYLDTAAASKLKIDQC